MRRSGQILRVIIAVCSIVGIARADYIFNFEDLTLGQTYRYADKFTTTGYSTGVPTQQATATVTCTEFAWSMGGTTIEGAATVMAQGAAGGTGNEINSNNINLAFDFDVGLTGLSLLFGEYGGNLNIGINGAFMNFENFEEIDDSKLPGFFPGVKVYVPLGGQGQDSGRLEIVGDMQMSKFFGGEVEATFIIGGQELWIDSVQAELIPEPATLLLFGVGVVILCRWRGGST